MPTAPVAQTFALAFHHHQAGRLAEAEALYRQILSTEPRHADALHLLGLIAQQMGRHDDAVAMIGHAVMLDPKNFAAHSNLGEAYRSKGLWEEAIASYRRALSLERNRAEIYDNLGMALAEKKETGEAIAAHRRALQLQPDFARAWKNLGDALEAQGVHGDAIEAYRRALALKPDDAAAWCNLGNTLKAYGQLDEAAAAYRRAMEHAPVSSTAYNNLGVLLVDQGRFEAAETELRRASVIAPENPEVWNNLGVALSRQCRPEDAIAAFERALEIEPHSPLTCNNLGNAFKDQGRMEDAIANYRRAIGMDPIQASLLSNLIYALHFCASQDAASIAGEQRRWQERFGEPPGASSPAHARDRDPERKLRIGYLSPDFRDHVVGRNILPLLEGHHREQFQVFCYSTVTQVDALTAYFRKLADTWRDVSPMSDEALAALIHKDGIDILVDLTQHMAGNRLPVFAHRPAPVQVSFAGYPESTGLKAIGCRLTDRHLEPGGGGGVAEQLFRLESFWCYDPCGATLEVSPPPAQTNGCVTFGSLNNFCKVNEPLLRLWARILREASESRLVLLSGAGSHRQHVGQWFASEGIEEGRIEFVDIRPREEYLKLYHRLDLMLDSFPYNGHSTSLDALWMGVPVVSLAGELPVSRAGLSQMTNLGLPELVARSEDEYVTLAVRLARDLPRLAELRRTLRSRMEASPIMDAPRFVRDIELAFRAMWGRWCSSQQSG